MKKLTMALLLSILVIVVGFSIASCASNDASVASRNLSQAADQFEIYRRVIFYNAITDTYILQADGFCSINVDSLDNQLEVTCLTGPEEFKKHYLGLSDNTTYFVEQMDSAGVSRYNYRVIFKPASVIPHIDIEP